MTKSSSIPRSRKSTKESGRVMIVDDDPDTLDVLAMLLRRAGFEPYAVRSGKECLRRVRKVNPSVIILDLMMPEMDGFEVCQALKSDPDTAHIPIIILTARDDFEARSRAVRLGVNDFIVKPASQTRLIARVKEQIELVKGLAVLESSVNRISPKTRRSTPKATTEKGTS